MYNQFFTKVIGTERNVPIPSGVLSEWRYDNWKQNPKTKVKNAFDKVIIKIKLLKDETRIKPIIQMRIKIKETKKRKSDKCF